MRNLTLLTDLYQITMGQGYFNEGRHEEMAAFDIFFRPNKLITYSVAAGMEQACDWLMSLHFNEDDIAYLRSLNIFTEDYLEYLSGLRFSGDMIAVKEGEIVFPYEPILTIKAPMIEAGCLLLVDTYDTLKSGVPNAIRVFKELRASGHEPVGIRLDSGDLAYLSKEARKMLDKAGFENAIICASGDLDEYSIRSLKEQGARIDSWGVGTKLITSADMPALGGVYKLAAVFEKGEEIPKIKLSDTSEKVTNPGMKDVYRIYDNVSGKAIADYIVRAGEQVDTNEPLELFHPVETWKRMTIENFSVRNIRETWIKEGERLIYSKPLKEINAYFNSEYARFWEEYTRLDMPHIYKVDLSPALHSLKTEMMHRYGKGV